MVDANTTEIVRQRRELSWSSAPSVLYGASRRFIATSPIGAFAVAFLILVVMVSLLANLIAPYPPLEANYSMLRHSPSASHPMGNDFLGRDVFTRLMFGARTSLIVAFAAVAIGKSIGFSWGIVSGYMGGRFDLFTQRIVEILLAFPGIILALMLLVALGSGVFTVIIAISIGGVAGSTRVIRSVVLSVKEMPYVDAARAIGASQLRVMLLHVAPSASRPRWSSPAPSLGGAIFAGAALSFLGLGVPPPNPSWGNMLNSASNEFLNPLWWMVVFPGMAITLTILAFNLFGDALRDHLDSKLRGGLD